MDREIKFRIWGDGRMCYLKPFHLVAPENSIFGSNEYMQFVGCCDKNNKDIYEGDIVWCDGKNRIVKYSEQAAQFYLSHQNKKISFYKEFNECAQSQSASCIRLDNVEVIGNIHENKELINQGDEDERSVAATAKSE